MIFETAIDNLLNLPGIPAVLQLNSQTREHAFEAYSLFTGRSCCP